MNRRNDDLFDTVEGDPVDDVLAAFVDELRDLATGPVPAPSAELAALLAGWPAAAPRRRPPLSLVGAVAASLAIVLAGAAARHALPQPAEDVVSHVVDRLTPFGLGSLGQAVPPRTKPEPASHPSASAPPVAARPQRKATPKRNAQPQQHPTAPVVAVVAHPAAGSPARVGRRPAVGPTGHHWNRHTAHRPWPHHHARHHYSRHHYRPHRHQRHSAWRHHHSGRHHWSQHGPGHRHSSHHGSGHSFGHRQS